MYVWLIGGMSGALVPAEGEVCAAVVSAPFRSLGDDITSNATCCALFVNPPHQTHIARPLEGQGFEVRHSSYLAITLQHICPGYRFHSIHTSGRYIELHACRSKLCRQNWHEQYFLRFLLEFPV